MGLVEVLLQSAEDVLDIDDRIIDQFADGHRQAAQRHGVDRYPEIAEGQRRDDDRQGNGGQRDQAGAEIPEEDEQDDDHPHDAVTNGLADIADRSLDEIRLPKNVRDNGDVLRQALLKLGQRFVDALAQHERVGAGLFLDRKDDRPLAFDAGVAAAHRAGVPHVGHFADGDRHGIAGPHHGIGHFIQRGRPADDADQRFVALAQQKPAAGDDIRLLDGRGQLIQRHVMTREAFRRREHLVLLHLAAHHADLRHAGDGQQPLANFPVGDGPQFHRRRLAGGLHAHQQDLAHDRGDRGHDGMGLLRQPFADELEFFGDDLPIDVDVGSPIKFGPDNREPDAGRRADTPHVAGPVHGRFDGEGDQRLDFLGSQAVRLGHDGDRGPIEVRKDVDRQLRRLPGAVDHQHDGHRQHEDPVLEARGDNMVEHGWYSRW